VVTGLGSEPAPLAVEARLEVGAAQPPPVADAATRPFDAPRLVVEGALLALTPSVLALLGLLLLWPQQGIRRALGPLSEIWPFAAGGFAGFLLLGLCLDLWSRVAAAPFFASPPALAAAALAPLGLALWTWYGHPLDVERPRSLGRDLLGALLAPFLALPWFPAAGALAPVAVGRATMPEIGLAAGGFAIPFLLTGALVTLRPLAAPGPWAGTRVRALGFLAAVSLIWVSYLLLDLIPTHRLAFLQLDWLLVALAVHMATVADRGRGLWWAVAFVLAVASVSLVAG
jgi:hypothetical protein